LVQVTAWHSGFSPQSAAVSLTCATWAFLPGWHMRVANHPLPKERPGPEPTPLVVLITRLTCGVFVPVGLAFLAAAYVLFPMRTCLGFPQERVRNVKLLQLLAGATSAAFWGSALLVDIVVHAVCSAVLLLPFVVFDWHGLYSDSATLGFVFLLMLVYGWASIPLAYVSSLVCDRPSTGYVAIASLSIVAGLVLNTAMTLLYTLPLLDPPTDNSSSENPGLDLALTAFRFIPSFALTWGLSNCLQNSQKRVVWECMSTFDRLPVLRGATLLCGSQKFGFGFVSRCVIKTRDVEKKKKNNSFSKSLKLDVISGRTYGEIIASVTAVIPSERKRKRKEKESSSPFKPRTGVRSQNLRRSWQLQAALLVSNLSKSYGDVEAVRGLSFALRKHECFGLLGVNGAGKTTTFRMLAGDLMPTSGNAFIEDADLVTRRSRA
ncbi:unnamed protein product, partial [Ixodes persulcatus]